MCPQSIVVLLRGPLTGNFAGRTFFVVFMDIGCITTKEELHLL